jgi:hypothetical protein
MSKLDDWDRHIADLNEEINTLRTQLAIAREALGFYGTMENYYIRFGGRSPDITTTGTSAVDADGGVVARKALTEMEG